MADKAHSNTHQDKADPQLRQQAQYLLQAAKLDPKNEEQVQVAEKLIVDLRNMATHPKEMEALAQGAGLDVKNFQSRQQQLVQELEKLEATQKQQQEEYLSLNKKMAKQGIIRLAVAAIGVAGGFFAGQKGLEKLKETGKWDTESGKLKTAIKVGSALLGGLITGKAAGYVTTIPVHKKLTALEDQAESVQRQQAETKEAAMQEFEQFNQAFVSKMLKARVAEHEAQKAQVTHHAETEKSAEHHEPKHSETNHADKFKKHDNYQKLLKFTEEQAAKEATLQR